MTLREATYNLLNLLRGGRSSNNEYYSEDQIAFNIQYYRALLIRRDLDRGGRTFELEQDLGLVPVELVDPSDGGLPVFNGLILRTTTQVPTPVRLRERVGITSVHSPDRRYAFPLMDFQQARWQAYNKFTGSTARSYYLNGDIYLIGDRFSKAVNAILAGTSTIETESPTAFMDGSHIAVRGIFEDPRAAYTFATGEEFDEETTEYPLPQDMYQRIVASLLSGEFKVLMATHPDNVADQLPDPS